MADVISAGDFRNGVTIEYNNSVYTIIWFQHVKPGKGAAFVSVKLKDVINGGVIERTFRPTETVDRAMVERKDMQYLYNDGDLYYFMDVESYEQIGLTAEQLGDTLKFMKENDMVKTMSHNGNVFGVELPLSVELVVTHTEPAVKGDTATNVTKPATLETGAEIAVPLFIEIGEKIKIDTRTGEYSGRAK